jgi:regulator of protease activity HflC (stomatin/prohibitin superfamily)
LYFRDGEFQHGDLKAIVRSPYAAQVLVICAVERNHVGVSFQDGDYVETLAPGQYAFWKNVANSKVVEVDMREQALDVAGQEIMTADKVTLRMNALVTYRITDARKAVMTADGAKQSLYREAQLALRAVVGTRDLDSFLTDKDAVTSEFEEQVRQRAADLGLEIVSVGVRNVILPGDMKDLMNKVTEAKKMAEANLISRREETAAMRSQANTAKLLVDNPTLMRLRELEVLERVATTGNLNVVLGEKGLADRVVNLL